MTDIQDSDLQDHDHVLTDYAAGNLTPAKHMIVSCQRDMSQAVSDRLAFQEDIAASFLSDIKTETLSDAFIGNVLAALPQADSATKFEVKSETALAPEPLRELLGNGLRDVKWKTLLPGVAIHDIMGNRKYEHDRLYLLKIKAGMKMPEHSHTGEEWTLILTGSYRVDEKRFVRGDLHIEDDTTLHSPIIDEGEDCICLVMTQGPLKMKDLIPRMVQPIVGI